MIISNKKKFLFVHIAKSGGSTLSRVLSIYSGDAPIVIDYDKRGEAYFYNHDCMCNVVCTDERNPSSLRQHHIRVKDAKNIDLENYFKFAFVRNPFDRLVSTWEIPFLKFRYPFDEFVEIDTSGIISSNKYYRKCDWLAKTQYDIVSDNDQLLVDYIGKYENIDQDFEYVRKKLDIPKKIILVEGRKPVDYESLPRINKTVKKDYGNYREYFNTHTRDLVEKYYKKDLETFEYEF
tara:strand:- start:2637 stop:3341 length:705 start_codon:yes stop_codon:yes gene_type:complete